MDEMPEMLEISQAPVKNNVKVLTKPKPVHTEESKLPTPKAKDPPPDAHNDDSQLSQYDRLAVEYDKLGSDYADLKREYKVCTRDIREQSLELRDIKRQNASMNDAYQAIQKDIQSDQLHGKISKNDRARYLDEIRYQEDKVEYYKHEWQKREHHLTYLTKQTRDANNEKESIEDENRKLQRKIRELSTNLTECRDDLLRLQPTSQQTPDSEIAEQYSNLCQHIATWVDDLTEQPDVLEEYFEKLKSIPDLPQDLRCDVSNRQFKFAKSNPECLPLLLQNLIHLRIQEEVLGPRVFVFGLDGPNVGLLKGIEEGMTELEPKRDALTVRRWRSETLRGLLKMDAFADEQSRHALELASSLASLFSCMLVRSSSTSSETLAQGIHTQILLPAIILSNTLRLSTTSYQHFSHLFARPPDAPNAVLRNEVNHYQMMDNASQKIIRADSNVRVAEDGRIGEEMFVIAPGMVRMGGEDGRGERVVLSKPVVLVRLDEPMGKRGRGVKALGAWTPSWFSGSGGGEEEE